MGQVGRRSELCTPTILTGAMVVEAVVLMASASSKMEDGTNPSARISGSHLILIGAITIIYKDVGVEGLEKVTELEDFLS